MKPREKKKHHPVKNFGISLGENEQNYKKYVEWIYNTELKKKKRNNGKEMKQFRYQGNTSSHKI